MAIPTKLQGAGRAFLLRLVAEQGPHEAALVLRRLADEIEGLARAEGDLPQFDLDEVVFQSK